MNVSELEEAIVDEEFNMPEVLHGIFVVGHVGGALLSATLALFLVISLRRYFTRGTDQPLASREFILHLIDCHFQLAIIDFLVPI